MIRPWLITVPGLSGVAVPAASSGAEVRFSWPSRGVVSGVIALPRSGLVADAARLSLALSDASMTAIVTDGRLALAVPFLTLTGRGFRWFPLRSHVERGDVWTFQVTNADAVNPQTPNVLFRLEPT